MPIKHEQIQGRNTRVVSLYTKEEIDRLLLNTSKSLTVSWKNISSVPLSLETIEDLTDAEINQLENIDDVTISNTQWGYLGALDQGVSTTDDVEFLSLSLNTSNNEGFVLNVNGTTQLKDDVTTLGDIEELNFLSGWIVDGGRGFGIVQDPNATQQWNAEFNDLLIRGTLKVFEFIVKQISVLGGTEILSVAVAEADTVTGSAGSETITVTDPRGFGGTSLAVDDLCIIQRVDINDTTVVKQEFRTVSSINTAADPDEITFTSTSGAPPPSDPIEEGDILVAYGNLTDPNRQNIIYRNVDKSTSAVINRLQEGVDSYSDFNNPFATTRFAYGDIDGFADYSSQTWGIFLGDNANDKITFDTSNGLRFLDSSNNIAAQLSGDIFKVGDSTNYLSFNANTGSIDFKADTFTLDAVSAGEGLSINSTDPSFKLIESSVDRVIIQHDAPEPTATLQNSESISSVIFENGTAPSTQHSNIYTLTTNDEAFEIEYTVEDAPPPSPTQGGFDMTVRLQMNSGTSGSPVWEDIKEVSYTVNFDETFSERLSYNTEGYVEARLEVVLHSEFSGFDGRAAVTSITAYEYQGQLVINSKGLFIRSSPNQIVRLGSGLNEIEIVEDQTTSVTWTNVNNKPFDTIGTGLSVTSDVLSVNMGAFTTDDLSEGSNLYYTGERVDDQVAGLIANGIGLSWTYNDAGGTLTGDVSLSSFDTGDLSEGSNLYYTNARVESHVAPDADFQNLGTGDNVTFNQGIFNGTLNANSTLNVGGILNANSGLDVTAGDLELSYDGARISGGTGGAFIQFGGAGFNNETDDIAIDMGTDGELNVVYGGSTNFIVGSAIQINASLDASAGGDFAGTFEMTDAVLRWSQDTDDAEIEILDYGSDQDWLTITVGDNSNDRLRIRNDDDGNITNTADFSGDSIVHYRDTEIQGDLQIDGGLIAEEFIIDQYRSVPTYIMSPAHGRVASVSGSAGSETVILEDPRGNTANPFQNGDIVIIKVLDSDNAILKNIFRRVDSISGLDVVLSTTGITWTAGTANDDTGSIEAGDFIVQQGHISDTTRDHYIRFDVANLSIPAIRFFDTVTDVNDAGDEIIRLGGMDSYDANIVGDDGIAFKDANGNLQGYITEDELKLAGGHTTGEWTGVQSGAGTTRAFFAGADDIDGANARFYVQADGNLFHESLVYPIYARNEVAPFGTSENLEAGSFTDDFWSTYITSATNGANDREIKLKIRYYHRFGINNLIANFYARTDNSGDSSFDNDVWITIYDAEGGTKVLEDNEEILSGSAGENTLIMDISSLTEDTYYIIQVEVEAQIGTVQSGTPTAGTELREDITIIGTT